MVMKVLYVGTYRDGTGWGHCSQNYILALDSVGVDVVPRPIIGNISKENVVDMPSRIIELEKKDDSDCDVCIQHVLPHMMNYNGRFKKNIGMFMCESSHFKNSGWSFPLNSMDHIFACNKSIINACKNSYVNVPVSVIPLCFDVSAYNQRYKEYEIQDMVGTFKFYTIGELRTRKNFEALLKAFHLEFNINEPVSLIIKSFVPGQNQQVSFDKIAECCKKVKNGLRLYHDVSLYKKEIIVTDWLSDHEIMRLHKTCDCFVLPSHGEAWGMPGFDAMAIGNPVILTNEGGPADFIENEKNGMLVSCRDEPAFIEDQELIVPGIWTGNENWKSVDIGELRKAMRKIYENAEFRKQISSNGIERAYDFSLEKIGEKMKEELMRIVNE